MDSNVLGIVTNPRATAENEECRAWVRRMGALGNRVAVPEIADYEIRRELVRAAKTVGIQELDQLATRVSYLPITTAAMRQAAEFWAQLRGKGVATASDKALDIDMVIAGQAVVAVRAWETLVIATTNTRHLSLVAPARHWRDI
ncbi:MAG: nuclease [Chloroflexota bacterium]|nr:nuclease [Chloroflexota bacterium]